MEKGTLVEFTHNHDRLLGVVQGTEGKKNLILAVASGHTHSVHPRQITFALASPDPFRSQDIPAFWQQVEPLLDPENLEIAWELMQTEHRALPLAELSQILFSSTAPVFTYATYRLLSDDRIFFKQKGESYEPRPQTQVKEIQHQLAVVAQKERELAEFEAHLQQGLAGLTTGSWSVSERLRLECLERFALHGDTASDRDQAIKLLTLVHRPLNPTGAFSTLVDLGIWNQHENLALRLSGVPIQFPPELEALATDLVENPPPDPSERLDLTHLHTYTIDDASTRDIDDALSVEWLPNGETQIWIHIADPGRWIPLGHPLDLEARRRGTSVYLPEQVIPMFPAQLATGPMSLVQGEVRCALSFGIRLTPEGAIDHLRIHPSLIKVTYRLTYEDADELLELGVERELSAIAAAAHLRFRWRSAQGAIQIEMPEQDIKVVDQQPQLRVIEDTPSRQLVSEMMVLTGEAVAQYAQAHDIPMLYRFQAQPDLPSPDELAQLPPGPVYSFALMRCMQRAEMTTDPARHSGLGLAAYSQATSPIRRYTDLVGHYQLKASIAAQELPFTAEQLSQLIMMLDPISAEVIQLERKTKRYWSVEYCRQHLDHAWQALVLGHLREYENLALVMIDEIAFRAPVRFQRHVQPGEWVTLQVSAADPRADILDFQEVGIRSPEA